MEHTMETTAPRKKRALSCIQPTGVPTLGNYLGALRNWVTMQEEFDCAYAVADLHAITVRQEPAKLRAQTTEMFALLLAIGLDPGRDFFDSVHCGLPFPRGQPLILMIISMEASRDKMA